MDVGEFFMDEENNEPQTIGQYWANYSPVSSAIENELQVLSQYNRVDYPGISTAIRSSIINSLYPQYINNTNTADTWVSNDSISLEHPHDDGVMSSMYHISKNISKRNQGVKLMENENQTRITQKDDLISVLVSPDDFAGYVSGKLVGFETDKFIIMIKRTKKRTCNPKLELKVFSGSDPRPDVAHISEIKHGPIAFTLLRHGEFSDCACIEEPDVLTEYEDCYRRKGWHLNLAYKDEHNVTSYNYLTSVSWNSRLMMSAIVDYVDKNNLAVLDNYNGDRSEFINFITKNMNIIAEGEYNYYFICNGYHIKMRVLSNGVDMLEVKDAEKDIATEILRVEPYQRHSLSHLLNTPSERIYYGCSFPSHDEQSYVRGDAEYIYSLSKDPKERLFFILGVYALDASSFFRSKRESNIITGSSYDSAGQYLASLDELMRIYYNATRKGINYNAII